MAKFGEGDARWIVTDRQDGKNVGAWHWEEKNMMGFLKDNAPAHFNGKALFDGPQGVLRWSGIEKFEGDAIFFQRKGRWRYTYDLNLKGKISGSWRGKEVKGEVHCPSIEFDEESFKVNVSIRGSGAEVEECRNVALAPAREAARRLVEEMLAALLARKDQLDAMTSRVAESERERLVQSGSSGHLKRKEAASPEDAGLLASAPPPTAGSAAPATAAEKKKASPETVLEHSWKFNTSSANVMPCLVEPGRLMAISGGAARCEPKVGGEFELFGGNIRGVFKEIDMPRRLVQTWRMASWPEGAESKVTMTFEDTRSGCTLTLKQTGIPKGEVEKTKVGWDENVFKRIRGVFGFSASNFL